MSKQAPSSTETETETEERAAHFSLSGDDVLSLIIEENETEEEEK